MPSRNEECLLAILREAEKPLGTKEVLDRTVDYPELCVGCKSGTEVIAAASDLVKQGVVDRSIGKGGFIWKLA